MSEKGLSRPGALQMVASAAISLFAAIGPVFAAAPLPNHEWFMILNGLPAFILTVTGVGLLVLYFIGFLRYCASKGYSKWLGFCLFLCNFLGLIILLLLPDLNSTLSGKRLGE